MDKDIMKELGITLIPQPQQIKAAKGRFKSGKNVLIVVPENFSESDRFAAEDLAAVLRKEKKIDVRIVTNAEGQCIRLSVRKGTDLKSEGYRMEVTPKEIVIEGNDSAGLFWGTRTLLQAFLPDTNEVPCMEIEDWPDIRYRMMHYDTKHHQDTFQYVQDFIRMLAGYKVNMLVWEWEDKLAYELHPEIGAPGAFTKADMQELTRYAKKYHMDIVPLVQGLGHVSYILKHRKFRHMREIPNSAWEFCPLKEESYQLLFDVWEEAMEATPGSPFLHIGSDETFELGRGEECGCKAQAEKIGRQGLMNIFLRKAAAFVESKGRKVISWGGRYSARLEDNPPQGLIFGEGLPPVGVKERLVELKDAGYEMCVYAPNPGIEPLFLGYFPYVEYSMWRPDVRRFRKGCFWDTAEVIVEAGQTGLIFGSITTSWDDSGLHNQAWVPRFICAAEYSWNCSDLDVNTWVDRFFSEYFGPAALNMRELFQLLQEGAVFYYDILQRRVWHWGDIGKIHLPDFPREELEYNPFFCSRYAQLLHRAGDELVKVQRALWIIDDNLSRKVKNRYDLEIYRTIVELILHNVELILMLGSMEETITRAHKAHFSDRATSLAELEKVQSMIEEHFADRKRVYVKLVKTWDKTRLPKGMSTADKKFLWAPDLARHFANRTPDMRYLIMDEELLGLEDYLKRLKVYINDYKANIDS
jgi:hexosaminidase